MVHYNAFSKKPIDNIDDLIMGRSENRSYYWGLGIPFKIKSKYHFISYKGIGVREVVLQLGNYSLVWEQLLKVYPKVNEYTVQFHVCY